MKLNHKLFLLSFFITSLFVLGFIRLPQNRGQPIIFWIVLLVLGTILFYLFFRDMIKNQKIYERTEELSQEREAKIYRIIFILLLIGIFTYAILNNSILLIIICIVATGMLVYINAKRNRDFQQALFEEEDRKRARKIKKS